MILVTGATGNVGREVLSQLLDQGAAVRALTRDPETADLPAAAGVVRGDLSAPDELEEHLDGVDAAFLIWPFTSEQASAEVAPGVVDTIARHVRRIVYLSAEAARGQPDSFWAALERLVERSGVEWTILQPTGFAANTRMWAQQIRDEGVVRSPYGEAARSLIHERDIAAVAVQALTEGGHAGAHYVLTGPRTVTQVEQVRAIGDAIGRPVRWEELAREDARDHLAEAFGDEAFADGALDAWSAFVDRPERVTSTVEEVTGVPARTFAQWAVDHAENFR